MLPLIDTAHTTYRVNNLIEARWYREAIVAQFGLTAFLTCHQGCLTLVTPEHTEGPLSVERKRIPKDYQDLPCEIVDALYADLNASKDTPLYKTLLYLFMVELNNLTIPGHRIVRITLADGAVRFCRLIFDYSCESNIFKISGNSSKLAYTSINWDDVVGLTL